jgi:hypothetical protein
MLAASCLLPCFLCLWCPIVAEVFGIFCRLVVEVVRAVEWAFAVGVVVATTRGWVACMLDQTEPLASVPVGEGYQLLVKALLVLLFLCQCTTFLLRPARLLSTFW